MGRCSWVPFGDSCTAIFDLTAGTFSEGPSRLHSDVATEVESSTLMPDLYRQHVGRAAHAQSQKYLLQRVL